MNISKVPVLFIIFNRINIAKKAFESIRRVKPQYLYIASDGPRKNKNEERIVEEVRNQVLNLIDWECELKTLFQEHNLGCSLGVYTAINWFFSHVEQGVILEDDCVVDDTFFPYMYEMLQLYKNDYRIGMIAGTNPINLKSYDSSYIFSKYKSCWGWATWRRSWENMDINMTWREDELESVLMNAGYMGKDISGWKYKMRCIDRNVVSAWDWQWYFSLSAQNQLCIYPKRNLVSNVGNDVNATHTGLGNITLPFYPMEFPLKHPNYIVPNIKFDELFFYKSNTLKIRISRMIPYFIKRNFKKIIFKFKQ